MWGPRWHHGKAGRSGVFPQEPVEMGLRAKAGRGLQPDGWTKVLAMDGGAVHGVKGGGNASARTPGLVVLAG